MPGIDIRFVVVQPEKLHAAGIIIPLDRVPNELAPLRIGRIIIAKISRTFDSMVDKNVLGVHAVFIIDQ